MYGTDDMLADIIQNLIDGRHTTAKEIAHVTGYASSTVYGWLSGQARIPADAIRSLCTRHPSVDVQNAICDAMTGSRASIANPLTDEELDVNGDGTIDCDDALDSAIAAVGAASRLLDEVRQTHLTKHVDSDTMIDISQAEQQLRTAADRTRQPLNHGGRVAVTHEACSTPRRTFENPATRKAMGNAHVHPVLQPALRLIEPPTPKVDCTFGGDHGPDDIVRDLLTHLEFDRARHCDHNELATAELTIDVTDCDAWTRNALCDESWRHEVYSVLNDRGEIVMSEQHELGCTIHEIEMRFVPVARADARVLFSVEIGE